MTNFGEDPIVADLTPDENSIQIIAYLQMCSTTTATPETGYEVKHTLTYGADSTPKTVAAGFFLDRTDADKTPV